MGKEPMMMDYPALDAADKDIVTRFQETIVEAINEAIDSGELSEIMGTSEIVAPVRAEDCSFEKVQCYWRNQTDMIADVWVTVSTYIREEDGNSFLEYQDVILSLFVSAVGGEVTGECEEIHSAWDPPKRQEMMELDKWYIPKLSWDDVEEWAENMWFSYDKEAAGDQGLRNPKRLARKMGLKIEEYIGRMDEPETQLRFADEAGGRDAPKVDTIRINRKDGMHKNDFGRDLYGACVAYEWHYLFYVMHGIKVASPEAIPMMKIPYDPELEKNNPIDFLKGHMNHAGYALMLPRSFVKDFLAEHYPETAQMQMTNGYAVCKAARLQEVANLMNDQYGVQPRYVRTRFLHLQNPEARNIFIQTNNGRTNLPFSVSKDQLKMKNKTFCIGELNNAVKVYMKDEKFRELVESGNYVYADGLIVCLDDDTIIRDPDRGIVPSPKVNMQADRFCLRFNVTYNAKTHYHYGYDASYGAPMSSRDRAADKKAALAWMTAYESFHELMSGLIRVWPTGKEVTKAGFIDEKLLQLLCTQEYGRYESDLVVGICLAMHLPPWASAVVLEKAHIDLSRYDKASRRALLCLCFREDFRLLQETLRYNRELPPLRYDLTAA